ncbi:MAG: thermonuclease family protein [Desulfovibrionaceae bacterium]|nr:thermonuclease family protein [Desulfovibrionaceae bacterium]
MLSLSLGVAFKVLAWPATVMHIYDGDTLTVAPVGDEECPLFVCLYGIDAPELEQPYGAETREWLINKLKEGSQIEVISMGIDNYGRTLAFVGYNGHILNREMVSKGYAWVNNFCKAMVCRSFLALEKKAKKAKQGLWSKDKPLAPWIWKQKKDPKEKLPLTKPEGLSPDLKKEILELDQAF